MPQPGDTAGDCPRCGGERVLVGHGSAVIGAHCSTCDLTVVMTGSAMTTREVQDIESEWDPDEYEAAGASWGPDPWG